MKEQKSATSLRGQLYELGEIASLGGSEKILPVSLSFIEKSKDSQKSWIDMYELIHTSIQKVITSINDQLDALESFIDNFVKENCLCKKLLTIPYIGPINAYALAYVMEDPKYYKNGREFAARAGTTPSFTGAEQRV